MDLLILGPTYSGKSDLANYIGGNLNLPVFNCDSIQIYKSLNCLTNKPVFVTQFIKDSEIVSMTKLKKIDPNLYENFNFICFLVNQNKNFLRSEFSNVHNLLDYVFSTLKYLHVSQKREILVENFLFDIKDLFDSYSSYEFNQDINRIITKFKYNQKIICGGTIYYAFNYLFDIYQDKIQYDNKYLDSYNELSRRNLLEKIKIYYPNILSRNIDITNKITLKKILYLLEHNYDVDKLYFRQKNIRTNSLIIFIFPKNRKEYYERLDQRINDKVNQETFDEIESLISKYGDHVKQWLSKLSYEYKYFIKILEIKKQKIASSLNIHEEIALVLQELKYKEHHYAKRQITFMNRFIKELSNYF